MFSRSLGSICNSRSTASKRGYKMVRRNIRPRTARGSGVDVKLEAAGYLKVKKEFLGKKPHTVITLTKQGRAAFESYRKSMREVLNGMEE